MPSGTLLIDGGGKITFGGSGPTEPEGALHISGGGDIFFGGEVPTKIQLEGPALILDGSFDLKSDGDPTPIPPNLVGVVEPIRRQSIRLVAPTLIDGHPPQDWDVHSTESGEVGNLQVIIKGKDVTFFRGVPTIVQGWSSGEPFDDASAMLFFPQITEFDRYGGQASDTIHDPDLDWLRDWTTVDIRLVPHDFPDSPIQVLWEGLILSMDQQAEGLFVTCAGALHELDNSHRGPRFISYDVLEEQWLAMTWSRNVWPRRHLRHKPLKIIWPDGWSKKHEGENATLLFTRYTGAWERIVTGYSADVLARMVDDDGNEWTIMKEVPRRPVLYVKDKTTVHWTVSLGVHGVELNLIRDGTQAMNRLYGTGIDQAGTEWGKRMPRSTSVDWQPIGYDIRTFEIIPDTIGTTYEINPEYERERMPMDHFMNFGSGTALDEAERVAQNQIKRDKEPGYTGTLILREVDPEEGSRHLIKAGQNLRIRHVQGRGNTGLIVRVVAAEHSPEEGMVTLTVDSKFRNLLTVQNIIDRNRDVGLNPARRLRVGMQSSNINDEKAKWDAIAGAGYIPLRSLDAYRDTRYSGTRTYSPARAQSRPPSSFNQEYIYVPARRWIVAPVYSSEKGTIMKTEIYAYRSNGTRKPVIFHASFYSQRVFRTDMPRDPWNEEAFDPQSDDIFNHPHPSIIIGWGVYNQRAGFSPGQETLASGQPSGHPVTGALIDEATWQFQLPPGEANMWLALYAETSGYFQGRIYHGVQQ